MEFHHFVTISLLLFIWMQVTSSAIIIAAPPTNKTTPTDPLSGAAALVDSTHFHDDLGVAEGAFDPTSDYFDHFSDLPYFPEFGEIFRLSRTTTPPPPFGPASSYYASRDAFPLGGGRRQRPPRPASSRTKLSKHHQSEHQQKPKSRPNKSGKGSSPNKARNFPKIFRFTSDRVNLADFDTRKKVNENYLSLSKGDDLDSDKVKRNEFLILHGGVFEIGGGGGSKGRPLVTAAATHRQVDTTPSDFSNSYEEQDDSSELESARYFYKT